MNTKIAALNSHTSPGLPQLEFGLFEPLVRAHSPAMDRFRPPQLNNSNDPSNTPRTFSFDNQSSRLQFNDRVIIRELDPALVPPAPRPVLDINLLPTPDETPRTSSQSPRQRLLAFFGVGSAPEVRQRKELLSFLWNVVFNSIQVCQYTFAPRLPLITPLDRRHYRTFDLQLLAQVYIGFWA